MDPTSTKIKPTLTDWIVAGFTIVLAVVGLLQWQVLSKQSKTLSNQLEEMKQDQRAWLKVVPVDSQNYTYGSGEKITVKLRVTNIGKSVAKNVTGVFLSEKTINGQNPNLDLFGNGSGKLHSVLFPGDFFDVSVDSYASHYPRSERLTANKEFLDELTSGRSFITTHGEVLYEDIFGVPHWVHFCTWSSNDSRLQGTVMKCTEFNKVDDNH